ncbi:sensor histidine kinase [Coleofasciculus sp. E1-EBD-02]|uniref:sensor histidine kinase n=1 Tax=Coleofasciculus sp. E1-EBD-02 TaxID=3068481 RepID=UPI004064B66B
MELIYLVVGIVMGLVVSRATRSSKQPESSTIPEPQLSKPEESQPAKAEPVKETESVKETEPVKEDELQPLKQELQQTRLAYQMAHEMSQYKAGFLARTSHELRSPLSSLMGMHQLILSDLCDSPEEAKEFVAQAHTSAQKMVKLLDEVIAVAKTEHGTNRLETRPLQLSQCFEELEVLTHMQAGNRNLRLKVISPDPEIEILADPRRFRQVLVGMVDSAIVQMEEGTIQVSTANSDNPQMVNIWIDVECPNSIWSEAVDLLSDTNDSEEQETTSSTTSPGMNWLMVQTLVEMMKGRLELLPIPGKEPSDDSVTDTCIRLQCTMPLATPEMIERVLAEQS